MNPTKYLQVFDNAKELIIIPFIRVPAPQSNSPDFIHKPMEILLQYEPEWGLTNADYHEHMLYPDRFLGIKSRAVIRSHGLKRYSSYRLHFPLIYTRRFTHEPCAELAWPFGQGCIRCWIPTRCIDPE